jgi:hypothetical protein
MYEASGNGSGSGSGSGTVKQWKKSLPDLLQEIIRTRLRHHNLCEGQLEKSFGALQGK